MPLINETIISGVNAKDATATSADILQGKTAVVGKELVTGSMPEKANQTVNGTFDSGTAGYITGRISQAGHYSTTSKLKIPVTNLAAANIKKGVNIGGIVGTYETPAPPGTGFNGTITVSISYFNGSGNSYSIYNAKGEKIFESTYYQDAEHGYGFYPPLNNIKVNVIAGYINAVGTRAVLSIDSGIPSGYSQYWSGTNNRNHNTCFILKD